MNTHGHNNSYKEKDRQTHEDRQTNEGRQTDRQTNEDTPFNIFLPWLINWLGLERVGVVNKEQGRLDETGTDVSKLFTGL